MSQTGKPGLSPGDGSCRGYSICLRFKHKSRIIDGYCAEIGRDPATLMRSVQIIIDPRENPTMTRQVVQDFITAGATHIVLASRTLDEGIAHRMGEEIIEPVREAARDTVL